jgi:ankyrin repeat protein
MGEIFRTLALAFDTKASNRKADRYARDGDFDWTLPDLLLDELFVQPLEKLLDTEFAHMVREAFTTLRQDYMKLVTSVALDSVTRKEALPLLVTHFFVPCAAALLQRIKQRWGGPDLQELLGASHNAIASVMHWLTPGQPGELALLAYPASTGPDRTGREMVQRWLKGAQLPDAKSMLLWRQALAKHAPSAVDLVPHLRRWLLIARALEWAERNAPQAGTKAELALVLRQDRATTDIGNLLAARASQVPAHWIDLRRTGLELAARLGRSSGKKPGDQHECKQLLHVFEQMLVQHDPHGCRHYALHWFRGRWHALSGEPASALPHYQRAVRLASYRAGPNQIEILKEALALAAREDDAKFIGQLKQQAIALGILTPPIGPAGQLVEAWERAQLHAALPGLFPPSGLFPQAAASYDDQPKLPFLLFDPQQMVSRRPDLRHPNRIVKLCYAEGQTRQYPQLQLFASFGRADAVRELLRAEADVNQLDTAGGSALLCAIQYARQGGTREVLDLLLAVPHSVATLNAVTERKRATVLFEAIDYCQPDVVATVLTMGADPEQRPQIEAVPALYYCVGLLGKVMDLGMTYQRMLHSPASAAQDPLLREALRRSRVSMAGILGDQNGMAQAMQNPRYAAIFQTVVQSMVSNLAEQHPVATLLEIIEILLAHGADANATVIAPVPGRTALMLAAESDSVPAFEMMLNHGGDPFRRDHAGVDSIQIARSFGAHRVLDYMHSRGVL